MSTVTMNQVLVALPTRGPNTKYPADAVIELTFKGRDEDFQRRPRFASVRAAFGDEQQATVADLTLRVANSLYGAGRIKVAHKAVEGFCRRDYGKLV